MNLAQRIKMAAKVLTKAALTYDINSLWQGGGYTGNVGVGLTGAGIDNAYHACSIAYACIDRMAKDAAGVPLKFLRDPEDMDSDVPDTDPVAALFKSPAQGFTTRRLVGWSTMMRQLRGECFWSMEMKGNTPAMIAPWFDPNGWKEQVSEDEGLYGWEYRQGNTHFIKPAGEVLWFGQDNPNNPYRGISPLQAAAKAVAIDTTGDTLQADVLRKGGERGLVVSYDGTLSPAQYEQLIANLATRRPGAGQASRDFILENLKLENPDFTKEDLDILSWQGASKNKICHVYGMAPVLIGDDDSAQYKSAPEAIRLYWNQTLVPLLRSYEDGWDAFFVQRRAMNTYVRFDFSKVLALQPDQNEQIKAARGVWDMGMSFEAVNERYGLGFSDKAAGFADAMPRPAAPVTPPPETKPPAKAVHLKLLTNAIIKARSRSTRFRVQRVRMLAKLERSTWNNLKGTASEYQTKTIAATKASLEKHGMTERGARAATSAMTKMANPMGTAMVKDVRPGHEGAAQVGTASIHELTTGKMVEWHHMEKAVSFAPAAEAVMAKRGSYIRSTLAPDLIDTMNDLVNAIVQQAGEQGEAIGFVTGKMREAWGAWSKGQALTIARTEVGTMYNTSRYEEMVDQEFEKHEWVTSLQESTRESHANADGEIRPLDQPFSTGLMHPLENGGPPEEVINCHCETIPVVED